MKAFTLSHTALALALALAHAQAASAGRTQIVLKEGMAAPGLKDQATFSVFNQVRFSSDGRQLAYFATLSGEGTDPSNREGIWLGEQLLARTSSEAPGTAGALFSQLNLPTEGLAYTAFLKGPGVSDLNKQGLWQGQALVAHTGDATPDGSGRFYVGLSAVRSKSRHAPVLYNAALSDGSQSIWQGQRLVAQDKMAAPGLPGLSFIAVRGPSQGPTGLVAYTATLSGAGGEQQQ